MLGGAALKGVLIIGGGTAGISAGRTLSRFGIQSTIVDKAPCVGGLANELACKGFRECVKCDVCLAVDDATYALQDENIHFVTGAKVELLERDLGRYRVTLESYPGIIDRSKCMACARCLDVCSSNAIGRYMSREGPLFQIDIDACRHDTEGCQECQDVCEREAIDLDQEAEGRQVEADAVIVATGSTPFDPNLDPRLGYGTVPGVITSLEAERSINLQGSLPDPLGKGVAKVAFVQCVGSRDPRLQSHLCSKVCCKYAMKLARQAAKSDKTLGISFFFMDWRPTDRQDDLLAWARINDRVEAIRSRPAEIVLGEDGRPTVRYALPGDAGIAESGFDLVVLSIGLRPNADNKMLADMLGARLGPHGFFFGEGKMVSALESKGIFFTGACTGPKDIEESAMDGVAAASKAARYLEAER